MKTTTQSKISAQIKTKTPVIYQLKVVLNDMKPPVWRRVLVRSDIKLSTLHQVLQLVMGWNDSHLHGFRGNSIEEPNQLREVPGDERRVLLSSVLKKLNSKLVYDYDFGDSWEHTVTLEKIMEDSSDNVLPICLSGKRACPPDDCGGAWNYPNILKALKDTNHPEHEDWLDWFPQDFDPEKFDIGDVNRKLLRLRR